MFMDGRRSGATLAAQDHDSWVKEVSEITGKGRKGRKGEESDGMPCASVSHTIRMGHTRKESRKACFMGVLAFDFTACW